ncbi:MAG: glycosyltransferase family 9 protein [Deltaproteobacteria bacterium]|nr:MAG: glycosyltransferase family 9 protein [Deltaproteobacteria bacterium]
MGSSFNYNLARRIDSWAGPLLCAALFAVSRVHALLGGPPQPAMRATTPPRRAPLEPRRILVIKCYGLGNVVMLLPVLAALRHGLPQARVDFLTLEEHRALLERSGLPSRVIGITLRGFPGVFARLWRALREVRAGRYDLVIDFEQFVKFSAAIAYLSGAPERIGFNTDGQRRGWLYTKRVVYTDSEHMSRIFARLLRPLAIDTEPRRVVLDTRPDEEARVDARLAEHGIEAGRFPRIAVHMGSGDNFYRIPLKRWPIENFAALCDELAKRHGAAILFTGKGAEERELVATAIAKMTMPAVDLCDGFSVTELLAFLKRCHLVIVNDTSVMHIAAAVRTPTVAFFGPTAPLHYGPGNPEDLVFYRDLHCSPCLTNYNLKVSRCTDPVCVRSIPPDEVLGAVEKRFLASDAPLRAQLERRPTGPLEAAEAARLAPTGSDARE